MAVKEDYRFNPLAMGRGSERSDSGGRRQPGDALFSGVPGPGLIRSREGGEDSGEDGERGRVQAEQGDVGEGEGDEDECQRQQHERDGVLGAESVQRRHVTGCGAGLFIGSAYRSDWPEVAFGTGCYPDGSP